ncbi:hypothetical protein [Methylobacterium brachythecii]|uniref:Uncharacterized protein n=1 Tax=Methylobacterium brachythecii TaxID=1176177 RepID=A0A7W6F5J3_9HYPH|nr:hypothetical protein [Methylobacterium brachythecii]MBB3900951.1 hypothetical protein [Methylobacterium brachythecii]GLS47101.1 hypothetical protein GCM10007884_51050 [Methylobacterium brachythecii]
MSFVTPAALRAALAFVSFGFAVLAGPAPALAQAKPNIVVMGEDADEDTVPRGNRIFQRVITELTETMNLHGYNVYDETAVAMGITQPNRVRRRDAELIDVARSVQNPPLDVVVIFQIYASASKSAYSDIVRPEVRIPGRLLNVRTGQSIGSFEVAGVQLPPLPQGCDRECLLEKVGAESKTIAADVASALTTKLDGFVAPRKGADAGSALTAAPDAPVAGGAVAAAPGGESCAGLPTAYVVKFNGFSSQEVQAAEEYMSAFRCYEHHRPVRSGAASAEYWYETRSDSARLGRNLRLMLEHMSAPGQVQFSGNTFVLSRVATR